MPSYPLNIPLCQHIKDDGKLCGSPALRRQKFCYHHERSRQKRLEINANMRRERWNVTLMTLEDANSIQLGLVQVMRLLVSQQIDHRTAALMVYALQTASINLERTSLEPEAAQVVIDRSFGAAGA
jgi:hypothetical protein